MISARFCLALAACLPLVAQPTARPSFEVASVKPSQSTAPARITSNPGMWACTNCSLHTLLGHAYKVFEYQIDAPDWARTTTFDVSVKLAPGVSQVGFAIPAEEDPFASRLQVLLEDRFQMTVRRGQMERAVYELVLVKGQHKMQEVTEPAPAPPDGPAVDKDGFPVIPGGDGMRLLRDRGRIQFRAQRMVHIAHFISTQVDRPVVDKTGLTGRYALTLSWYRENPNSAEPLPGPTIYEAVSQQLGLKLEPGKGLIDMVVIERAQKTPVAN